MAQYRKKPVVIEAVQYDGNFRCLDIFSINEVGNFKLGQEQDGSPFLLIPTLEGDMKCSKGDYVIKGIKGEYYPCKPDIFEATYEQVYIMEKKEFIKDIHYYLEEGRVVFTALYHLKRGHCCGNNCRHCPYEPKAIKGNKKIADDKKR